MELSMETAFRPVCERPCGFTPNTFALYHSPDLVTWQLVTKNILPSATTDNDVIDYWMPNVFHNPHTSKYVMQY